MRSARSSGDWSVAQPSNLRRQQSPRETQEEASSSFTYPWKLRENRPRPYAGRLDGGVSIRRRKAAGGAGTQRVKVPREDRKRAWRYCCRKGKRHSFEKLRPRKTSRHASGVRGIRAHVIHVCFSNESNTGQIQQRRCRWNLRAVPHMRRRKTYALRLQTNKYYSNPGEYGLQVDAVGDCPLRRLLQRCLMLAHATSVSGSGAAGTVRYLLRIGANLP